MDKKIKALFILPSLAKAGAETQLIDLINGLSASKYKKYLFTSNPNEYQKSRLDLERIYYRNDQRKFKLDISPAITIAKFIDKEDIDVIHCTLQISLFLGWIARIISKKKPKLISAIHTTINRSLKDDLLDQIVYRFIMKKCHKIIFVCHSQKKHWVRRFPFLLGKSDVIYNGIDVEHFNPVLCEHSGKELKKSLGINDNEFIVCSVANFREEKGHFHLCNALSLVKKPIHLILAGEGPLKKDIQNIVKQKQMSSYVHFMGVVSDVRPIFSISHLSVIPSTAETFPLAMLESMCMGTPVLARNIGGLGEAILHEKTGFLVPPGSPVDLAEALLMAYNSPDRLRAIGQNARTKVLEEFSKDKMIQETDELITTTLSHYS